MKIKIYNNHLGSYINFITKNLIFIIVKARHHENYAYIHHTIFKEKNLNKYDDVEISNMKAGVKLAKLLGARYDFRYQ